MGDEILDRLSKIDLFTEVPPKHLDAVADLLNEQRARDSEEIIRKGTYSSDFYVIFSGSAAVSVRGKQRGTLGPGEFFGEVAILGHVQATTVKALEEMSLGVIDAKQFSRLLESEPTIAIHMLKTLIVRLEELTVKPVGQLI